MKKGLRTTLIVLLVLILAGSIGGLIYEGLDYWERMQENQQAQEMVDPPEQNTPDPTPTPTDSDPEPTPTDSDPEPTPTESDPGPVTSVIRAEDLSLEELKAINPDVIGWIKIPGTPVNYPVVQGKDNDYYLNRTWRKSYNSGGSIFMEWQNSSDFSDFNTIVYGHRMNDRTMFNCLQYYKDISYYNDHPQVYITIESGTRVYDIFAACEVHVSDPVYWLIGDQNAFKKSMINFCMENSVIDTGVVPTVDDKILTLSTCVSSIYTSDYRWVVLAVERSGN